MLQMQFTVDARSLARMYREVAPAVQRRHMRRSLMKAAKPMVTALRREARAISTPDSTGALGKAIGTVVRTDRLSLVSNIRIGALRKPAALYSYKNRQPAGRRSFAVKNVTRKPSRYFHLAAPRRDGQERVERLFNQHKQQMQAVLIDELEWALQQEAARLAQQRQ